jgi:rod shape-determining protein MreC
VEVGELFFTSGEDRVFPKGLPVGKVTGVGEGTDFQAISVQPSGGDAAPEEVLVIVNPLHQEIPEAPPADTSVFLSPPVKPDAPAEGAPAAGTKTNGPGTQADKLMDQYRKLGESQKYTYGEGGPGSSPMNFNVKVPGVNAPAGAPPAAGTSGQAPPKPVIKPPTDPNGQNPPKPVIKPQPADPNKTEQIKPDQLKPAPPKIPPSQVPQG